MPLLQTSMHMASPQQPPVHQTQEHPAGQQQASTAATQQVHALGRPCADAFLRVELPPPLHAATP